MNKITDLSAYHTDDLVEWYIKNRDYLAELKRAYEEQEQPTRDVQAQIEAELHRRLNEHDATSLRTEHGQVVRSTRTSYTAQDKRAFGEYIIAKCYNPKPSAV